MKKDIIQAVADFYKNINPVYRKSFWILFAITNVVFGFYTINFFWGNHDWIYMTNGIPLSRSFFEGRYGAYLFSRILTGGLYLPIISALWSFIALSLSAVVLAVYWKIPQRTAYFVTFGLILNITPYTLVWFFFGHWIVDIYFARLFIFAAFLLSAHYTLKGPKWQKILVNLIAILFLNYGISVYQAFINTIIMLICGRFLIEMLNWTSLKDGIKTFFTQHKWTFFDIFVAVALYKIVFQVMRYKKLINEKFYSLQTVPLSGIPSKIWECIKASWTQFTDFSVVFYPSILTKLFLVLALIFFIYILFKKHCSWCIKAFIFITFFATLFLTKFVACISQTNILFAVRTDLCSYVLFNALIICLCLKSDNFLPNTKIILMGIIIYIFAVNCFHYQRTFKLGFEAEKMIWNRMLSRLENHPDYNPKQKYTVIQLGKPISARDRFYPRNIKTIRDREMLTYSFDCSWQSFHALNFYNFGFVKKDFGLDYFKNQQFMEILTRLDNAGKLKNAKAWPLQNSIIVYKDIILLIMNDKSLEQAKKLLKENNEKVIKLQEKKE